MELENLKSHILTLIDLDETEAPVISCYLNLEGGASECRKILDKRVRLLRLSLTGKELQYFEEALAQIESFLLRESHPHSIGVAIFSRGGGDPFFLPLQFKVPLPNWIVVDSTPNIYHLVELKDVFHRYVVMLSTEDSAQILEINLGEVTTQLWKERPDLRKRVGREWTKEHYQHHRKERTEQFIKEKINILEKIILERGYFHLILAGNPRITARVEKLLPRQLADKLVDKVVASGKDNTKDVVLATIASFVDHEEQESRTMVDILHREINTNGLAVVGTEECLKAFKHKQVDALVLASAYDPEAAWKCKACNSIHINPIKPDACSECGEREFREISVKEAMVKMAEKDGCKVETVKHSDILMSFGGVGCLLRYLRPEQY